MPASSCNPRISSGILVVFLLLLRERPIAGFSRQCRNNKQGTCSRYSSATPRCFATANDEPENNNGADASIEESLRQGLDKMNQAMTPAFFLDDPVLKTFYSKICKNVEIRESSIEGAGRGLFAKKAIKANTIVSFYPAHTLGVDGQGFVVTSDEDDYFRNHPSSQSAYLHCTDQPLFQRPSMLVNNNEEPIYLDINPNREIVGGWVSQIINDGATVEENSDKGVLDYYRASGKSKNCIHIPFGPSPILATVTTKKVKKGEELLTSYGGTYWLGVWLDVHGEEGVTITPAIQSEIQASARDLMQSMQSVNLLYKSQLEALQSAFDEQ
jgi:hypothetical protein